MKHKLLFTLLTLLFISCQTSIKSPVTQIEYRGEISKDGIGIAAKPPFWDSLSEFGEWLTRKDEAEAEAGP